MNPSRDYRNRAQRIEKDENLTQEKHVIATIHSDGGRYVFKGGISMSQRRAFVLAIEPFCANKTIAGSIFDILHDAHYILKDAPSSDTPYPTTLRLAAFSPEKTVDALFVKYSKISDDPEVILRQESYAIMRNFFLSPRGKKIG